MTQGKDISEATNRPLTLAPNGRRLFTHYSPDRLSRAEAAEFVIGRLLEEGETKDLKWLTRTFSEDRLADWLGRRGGRQLTRRSRAFWQLVLGCRATVPEFDPAELWPL